MKPFVYQLDLYVCDWKQFIYETGIYVSWYTYFIGKQFFDEYTYAIMTDEPVWVNRSPMLK